MIATTKNFDVICFELRNHYPQLDNPLKKEMDKLLTQVKEIVTSDKKIKPILDNLIKDIFNLRVNALKWMLEFREFELTEMMNEVYPQFEELRNNPQLEVLAENILFALRCNRKVFDAVMVSTDFSKEIGTNAPQFPGITYEQFLSAIAIGVPDDLTAQKIVDWTNSSLYIEFVTLAAATIHEDQLKVSDKSINELAFIIADAAQEYSALATELGFVKPRSSRQSFSQVSFDDDFVKEQKTFADLGLDDYSRNLF